MYHYQGRVGHRVVSVWLTVVTWGTGGSLVHSSTNLSASEHQCCQAHFPVGQLHKFFANGDKIKLSLSKRC